MRSKNQWNDIKNKAIYELQAFFRKNPYHYFTEHDIHSTLYHLTQEQLRQYAKTSQNTVDGYNVNLVHHEYPTPFRCDMQDYKFRHVDEEERTTRGGLFKRGHYDLVILNPDFVRNNTLEIVTGKNYKRLRAILPRVSLPILIWTSEIIFFPKIKKLPKNAINIVEQDTRKIQETQRCNFCRIGSVHVFTSHPHKEATELGLQIANLAGRQVEITFTTA